MLICRFLVPPAEEKVMDVNGVAGTTAPVLGLIVEPVLLASTLPKLSKVTVVAPAGVGVSVRLVVLSWGDLESMLEAGERTG